jgi:membrane protease YdiL (CAAX protease family)
MSSSRDANARPFAFFVLLFLISIPFWIAGAVSGAFLLPGLPLSALGAFCPVLAAMFLLYRESGWPGATALLARSFDWTRIGRKAWLAAAVLLPVVPFVVTLLLFGATGATLPAINLQPLAVVPMFAAFLVAALGEELGWSGYALDPLQARFGALPAALMIGAVWAVWHYIPLIQAHRALDWIAWWALATIARRVIMVWLYDNAGRSVFAVALFHATGNLVELGALAWYDPRITGLTLAAIALALVIFSGPRTLIRARLG